MHEINLVTELSWLDKLLYRYALIPITRQRLMEREAQFAWIYRTDVPDWGRGRDDGMNLTKYFMLELPMDDSVGATDMPAIWNLKKYDSPGTTMNYAGDSHDAYSVIIDSALGLMNAAPKSNEQFLGHVRWMQEYLSNLPPPEYPFPIDVTLGAADVPACWNRKKGDRPGTPMKLAGDRQGAYVVIIDSAVGLMNAAPKSNEEFLGHVRWMQEDLSNLPPPEYPVPIDAALAAAGKPVFAANCASCHASDQTGKRMALAGIDTDPERTDAWHAQNAIPPNRVVSGSGIDRKRLVEAELLGYTPPFPDGLCQHGRGHCGETVCSFW